MYNKLTIMGRICNDLEVKTTPNGKTVLSFRIAVERSYTPKGTERKSDFFNVVAWEQNADFVSRFFSKGRLILLDGELQTRQYTDKNGQEQTIVEIVVSKAYFTGEPKRTGSSSEPPAEQTKSSVSGNHPEYTAEDYAVTPTDDDYPF